MRRPNENALTPASLATDGEQGEGAKAAGLCGAQHSPQGCAALFLVRVALDTAQAQPDLCALATNDPLPWLVDAANRLDAAAVDLAQLADSAHPKKGGHGGAA